MGWWKHQPRCRERERNRPRSLVGPRQVSRPWRIVLHPHAAARVGLPRGNAAPRASCLPQTSSSFFLIGSNLHGGTCLCKAGIPRPCQQRPRGLSKVSGSLMCKVQGSPEHFPSGRGTFQRFLPAAAEPASSLGVAARPYPGLLPHECFHHSTSSLRAGAVLKNRSRMGFASRRQAAEQEGVC